MSQQQLELPKGWSNSQLEDCVDILDGKRVPINSKERAKRKGEIPYYGATGRVGWIDDYLFDEELVLVGEDGAPFLDRLKDTAYIISGKSWVNNHAHVLRAINKLVSNKLLCHYLNIFDYHEFVTGTTRLKLNQSSLRKIPIRLPPLNEQKRIVSKIEELFSKIDSTKQSLKHTKLLLVQYRYSFLKSAFEGKHTEKWEIKKLGDSDVSEIIMGQSPPGSTYNKEKNGMPFFQGIKDFGEKFPIATVWCTKPKKIAKKGDILLSVRAPVGTTNWAKEECCIGRGLVAIRPKIQSEYVYCFLKSIKIKLSVSGVGSVFNAISKGELCQISLPVPSLQEQEQIVSQIEQGFSLIENSQRIVNSTLQTLETMRMSVLKQAFQGKLVPQDPNDEPAEILLERIKKQKS